MRDLDELRSLSHQLRPPSLEALEDTARRRDRRAAAVVAAGVTSVVAAAMTVALVVSGPGHDRSQIDPAPSPTPSTSVPWATRRAMCLSPTSRPTISAAGRARNHEHRPRSRRCHRAAFRCRSRTGSHTSGVLLLGRPGHVVRPDRRRRGRFGSGRCDGAAPGITASLADGHPTVPAQRRGNRRPWWCGCSSRGRVPAHRDCFEEEPPTDCQDAQAAPRAADRDRRDVRGVRVEQWAPAVAEVVGQPVGALASIDGDDYVLSTVAQGPGAAGLSLDLDPAGPERPRGRGGPRDGGNGHLRTQAASRGGGTGLSPQPAASARRASRAVRTRNVRCAQGLPPSLLGPPLYRVRPGRQGGSTSPVARGAPENVELGLVVFEATG